MEYPDRVPSIDYLSKPERDSGNNLPRACLRMKLQDKFKLEKPRLSYTDFHHEITKSSKFLSHPQKQRVGVDEVDEEDEVVKYMSKLPSYLQKGEALKEKALNVGVLDWGLLEKWQCNQKQMPYRSNGYSPSSSNTSTSFSTDESSTHSSRGHSCSPTHQRIRRPSLQSHLSSSLTEGPSQVVESSGECLRKFQAIKSTQSGSLYTRAETFKMTETLTETRAIEDKTREEKVQKPNSELNSSNGHKQIVLLSSKGDPGSSNSAVPRNSNLEALATRKSIVCQRRFSEGFKKACHSEQLSSGDVAAVSIDCPSASSKLVSQPLNSGSDLSRGILEAKKEIAMPVSSTSVEHHSKPSEKNPKKATAEKVRSISPFYRFTGGASKTSKSSSSKDSSDIHNQKSTDMSDKSGRGNSRARSSPLRRLLDPLLKPKAENSHRHSAEPSDRVSVPTDNGCKPVDGQHASVATWPGKVKLGMTGCKKISVNELAMGKKHGPSIVRAVLRVAVKNGLPLYTFAVNNENNILAATVKVLDAEKNDGGSCIYTFFTIQDVKRKNGGTWINQGGGRGKCQDYVSNVVAQMKVSDCGYSGLSMPSIGVREFVLFSVDLRRAEDQASEFQPKEELAAILVKYPKKTSPSSAKDKPVESASLPDSEECRSVFGTQDSISTTVVFPSAVHSLPSKGGPSSLIERWISGGSCDCGGWDLGCKLRILSNVKRSGPSAADRFELFPQGGLQENQQVFSLTPFKEGTYSVEFHSSVSVLQAFSICTAELDTRKQKELSESSTHSVAQNAGTSRSKTEGEGPRYVSYPPHSPVGRV